MEQLKYIFNLKNYNQNILVILENGNIYILNEFYSDYLAKYIFKFESLSIYI